MNIALVVTGSISVYKSAELVRELVKLGHSVQVVMSEGAKQFVTPLTFQTLSGRSVATDLWNLQEEASIGHIKIADEADIVVVAPASANFIAKVAGGFAEGIAQAVLLATKAPVLVCPAMNVNMWDNAATKENIAKLISRGIHVLEPSSGELACGWVGQGRLPDLDVIVSEIETIIPQPLKSKTVLVTAGPTREKIDPMRVITNLSSGKTGIEIALEAKRLGAKVKLIAGPGVNIPHEMEFVQYESAVELDECLQLEISKSDPYSSITLVMAAAPADFRPASVSDEKLPHSKDKGINLELIPNPDILKGIAARRKNFPQLEKIVAFAANDKDGLIERASQKLKNKNADYIVANDVKLSANQETTELFLLDKTGLLGSSTKVSKQLAAKWLVKELFQL